MMKTILRSLSALRISLLGLHRRWWSSLNSVLGTAVVVGVMVAILAIGAGYSAAMRMSEADDAFMVLRGGAQSEMESTIEGANARLIETVRSEAKDGLAVGEVYVVTTVDDRDGDPINVALRGISEGSAALRPGWTLVEGRDIVEGRRELLVGHRAQQHFGGLDTGSELRLGGAVWTVVGVFEAGGSLTESEIWGAATPVQDAFDRQDSFQVVITRPQPGETAADVETALNRDSRLNVSVISMQAYYEEQARAMRRFVAIMGYGIGGIMALGAIFAALNTGLSHIKARAKELATLSILGWTRGSLMLALTVETVLMTLIGGLLGVLAVYLILGGRLISTLFFAEDFTQIVFDFAVTWQILFEAAAMATVIGLLGSIGPALQIRRLPIARILLERR
jgi:putative ABC transport system permease protein